MQNPKTSTGFATLRPARRQALLPAILLVFAGLAAPLSAADMKNREANRVLAEARASAAKGNVINARELFQLVAEGSAKLPERRADAYYELALLEAAQPADKRDGAGLASSVETFLREFPKDKRRPVVAAVAGVMADVKAREAELDALEAKVAADEQVQKEASAAGAKDSSKKVDELEAKLRRSGAEVESLRAELAKKDEALKKLKKVAAGDG